MVKKQPLENDDQQEQLKQQNNKSSQGMEQNESIQIQDNEDIADNMDIPFEDFRKSFSVFSSRNKPENLKSYVKIKTQLEVDHLKNAISLVDREQKQEDLEQQNVKNLNNQTKNPQQFFSQCKVPQNTTILIHIFSVDNKRCNIKVSNVSGYVIAYQTDIMPSRKFYKIYKILAKIGNKSLYIIFDEYDFIEKDSSFVKKISDYAKNFCYYTIFNEGKPPKKFTSINLQQQKLIPLQASRKQKPTFIWIENHMFWYFSQIFTKKQGDFEFLLKQMKSIQFKLQNPTILNQLNEIEDSSMNFMLKSILINMSKFKIKKTTSEILEFFMKMIENYENSSKQKVEVKYGNPLYHYPEMLKISKQCAYCQHNKDKFIINAMKQLESKNMNDSNQTSAKIDNKNKKQQNAKLIDFEQNFENKKSKTKYRCEGCSAEAQKDIPLCLGCFKVYHDKKQQLKKKNARKAEYLKQLKKKKKLQSLQKKRMKNSLHLLTKKKNQLIQQSKNQMKAKNLNNFIVKKEHIDQLDTTLEGVNLKKSHKEITHKIKLQQTQKRKVLPKKQSKDQDSGYSIGIRNKLKQLQSNNQYNKLRQRLERQKGKFFKIFKHLIKRSETKNIAIATAEFVKYRTLCLFNKQRK